MKCNIDYIDFAIDRALTPQEHLQLDDVPSAMPCSIFQFLDRQSFYRSLDRKKYEDAKAGFMFCGSMFEAYTIVSKSDVPVQPGNFHCLDLASQTVDALVFNIDNPDKTATLKHLQRELKKLERDFQYNIELCSTVSEDFSLRVKVQVGYLQDTLRSIEKLCGF
ncbi:hypothetical protein N7505_007857 [Penicillium chrysogenum]|uniref:Uncharacterized protein n=1 Tax=Penicillium chrysogenum TaxID=5076 RepID=A0ABQ8WFH7_PENCH|nr:hypothetical protein N7505_007857 [Penicillium chrysogenum]